MPKVEDEDFIQGVFAVRDPWTWACTWCTMDPLSLLEKDEHGKPNPAMDLSEIVDKVGWLVYDGASANHKEMEVWSELVFDAYLKRGVRDHASIELLADAKDPRTGLKFKSLIQPCVWIWMEAEGGDRKLAVELASAVLNGIMINVDGRPQKVPYYCPCVHRPEVAKAILGAIRAKCDRMRRENFYAQSRAAGF